MCEKITMGRKKFVSPPHMKLQSEIHRKIKRYGEFQIRLLIRDILNRRPKLVDIIEIDDKGIIYFYVEKYKIKLSGKKKYRLFSRGGGICCAGCGIKPTHYWVEENTTAAGEVSHTLNLYGNHPEKGEVMFNIDHIQPKSLGGSNSIDNMQIMCEICNTQKGNYFEILIVKPEEESD
jgi:hypothetical protein